MRTRIKIIIYIYILVLTVDETIPITRQNPNCRCSHIFVLLWASDQFLLRDSSLIITASHLWRRRALSFSPGEVMVSEYQSEYATWMNRE